MNSMTRELEKRRLKPAGKVSRGLAVFHRRVGVALCLFFAMWFATGAVVVYVPSPFLPDGKRIAGIETLVGGQIKLGPAEAVAASGIAGPARVRLVARGGDGLRVSVKDGVNTAVYVNPVTGKVIEVMDTSRRAYRWLYFGLHTLDFPFLSNDAVWKPLMSRAS